MGRTLGLDVGTTVLKGVVVDEGGTILAGASRSSPIAEPAPGWTEQDPEHDVAPLMHELAALERAALPKSAAAP